MAVKNCKRCGKMFNYITGDPICPQCKEAREAKFQEVKKYIQDNKQASIPEIVKECDVDQKILNQWIREERLFFLDDSPVKINCEKCGCQIATGRFCDKCKKETASNFSNASRRPDVPPADTGASGASSGIKMHTFRG